MYSQNWGEYTTTRMWVDPSGAGADSTGFCICSYVNGYLWCHTVGGLEGGYSSSTLEALATLARDYRVREIVCEDNWGQGMFLNLFQPVLRKYFIDTEEERWGATLEGFRVSGQKEVRIIQALEPVMNQHRLIIDPSITENQELQRQIVHITRERNCLRHDDEIESLAMCVKLFEDLMSADPDSGEERRLQQKFEDDLNEHYASMGLNTLGSTRWFEHK